MIIDCNMHWMPETLFKDEALLNAFLRTAPKSANVYAKLSTVPGTQNVQMVIEQPKGYPNLNYTTLDVDAVTRVANMDKAGVQKAILRLPCWEEWIDLEMAKKINNMMAQTVKKYPGRLFPLAIVPPWGDKESLDELERCVKDLGCVGIELAAHYGRVHLDESELRPLWKKISELGIPAVIHHTPMPSEYESIYQSTNVRRSLGRIFAQLTCVGRLVNSDLYEQFPDLKVIHSYLGGGFFAFTNMMAVKKTPGEEMERSDTHLADKVDGYLKRNVYFDMCHAPPWGKEHLEFAIKIHGADHILYGSTYPVKLDWVFKGVDFIKKLDINEEEKALVLGGNAARLFKIK